MRASTKIIVMLSCLPALASAEVYRWVDANGVVNYTQQKPADVSAERIESQTGARVKDEQPAPPAATPAPDATQPPQDRLTDAQREALQGLEAAEQARQAELANIRQANCERARGVLDRLSAYGRIKLREADGTERMMTEEERQERVAEAQRGVVENCVDGNPG